MKNIYLLKNLPNWIQNILNVLHSLTHTGDDDTKLKWKKNILCLLMKKWDKKLLHSPYYDLMKKTKTILKNILIQKILREWAKQKKIYGSW
jgi:hypothetical protein